MTNLNNYPHSMTIDPETGKPTPKIAMSGPSEHFGTSTDVKPTENLLVGSTYFEIDTSTAFMWDGSKWVAI